MNLSRHYYTDPMAKILQPGIVLWRGCSIVGSSVTLSPVEFKQSDREDSYIARLLLPGNLMTEPEVVSHTSKGIILFVDEPPPEDWTHLKLTGVTKAFRAPTTSETTGAAFAKAMPPLSVEVIKLFRQKMNRIVLDNLQYSQDEERLRLASDAMRFGIGVKRLFLARQCGPDVDFLYQIVED